MIYSDHLHLIFASNERDLEPTETDLQFKIIYFFFFLFSRKMVILILKNAWIYYEIDDEIRERILLYLI